MATDVENGAWGGSGITVNELDQRVPKRFVYRRKAGVECGIAKKRIPPSTSSRFKGIAAKSTCGPACLQRSDQYRSV